MYMYVTPNRLLVDIQTEHQHKGKVMWITSACHAFNALGAVVGLSHTSKQVLSINLPNHHFS